MQTIRRARRDWPLTPNASAATWRTGIRPGLIEGSRGCKHLAQNFYLARPTEQDRDAIEKGAKTHYGEKAEHKKTFEGFRVVNIGGA
jgi:hypothetical protein